MKLLDFSSKQNIRKNRTVLKRSVLIIFLIIMCFLLAACGERVRYHDAGKTVRPSIIDSCIGERG